MFIYSRNSNSNSSLAIVIVSVAELRLLYCFFPFDGLKLGVKVDQILLNSVHKLITHSFIPNRIINL